MIADFVNNVCQAKHLLCNPFPIDFRRASKSIPAIPGHKSAAHSANFHEVHQALGSIRAYFAWNFATSSPTSIMPVGSTGGVEGASSRKVTFSSHWVPP